MNTRTRLVSRSVAFTLVELLVVIAIFVLLLAIAVPAFSSMLYSSEQSLADNHLRMGLAAARDAAVRSAQGADSAAVFFYDPLTGHCVILPCVKAGTIKDLDTSVGAVRPQLVDREVFVPAPGFEPVQLPRGWGVRGYAAPGSIDDAWYEKTYPGTGTSGPVRQRGNWLFPETAFYDEEAPQNNDGADRQTFMVRFEGGTGIVKSWDQSPVIVLAVNPSTASRQTAPWNVQYPTAGVFPFRVDLEPDAVRFVRRVAAWPVTGVPSLTLLDRQNLLGDISGDTVLAKPVGQLALCNEKKLSFAIGVRLDPTTNSLYQDVAAMPTGATREPTFISVNGGAFTDAYLLRVNDWIEDHLYSPRQDPPPIPPLDTRTPSDCRIYSIQRYLGTLQEISGTIGGGGVSQ